MNTRIWLSPPDLGSEEKRFVEEAFQQNWIAPLGPNVDNFEVELARYAKISNVVALSSGTAAIHLALLTLGIGAGDHVLCSDFTFCGSVNPVKYVNAAPVFIDSDEESWNMSPVLLKKTIHELKSKNIRPRGIILVHLYGMPARLDELLEITSEEGIPVIEDAAEAVGSMYKKRVLGTFGEIGIFSFNGNKIITTSGGGAMITENEKYARYAKFLATQAREKEIHYEHTTIGYNYRMSNILAGIGRGQLKVLESHIQRRREINKIYREELAGSGIRFLTEWSPDCYSNCWLTTMTFPDSSERDKVMNMLNDDNIECRPLWKPMHLQPVFQGSQSVTDGTSEKLFRTGLCVPSGSNLKEADLERIIGLIRKSLR
jgi:dTDP-4-amino-4,6-dideoxygalactose transaminase